MILGIPLSGVSIFFALVGICINLICTTPYVGASFCVSESELEKVFRKIKWAKRANILIVMGTAGQFASLFLKR